MSNQTNKEQLNNDLSGKKPSIEEIEAKFKFRKPFHEQFYQSAFSQKKVSKTVGMKLIIDELFRYVEYFSLLNQDDTVIKMGSSFKTLDQIPVLNEMKDFIAPASVKLIAGNRRMPCLIDTAKYASNDKDFYSSLEFSRYMELMNTFRGYFKKDISDNTVTLSSIKKELALLDVLSIAASVTDNVNYDSDPFYPIYLKLKDDLLNNFLQDDADVMIKDYCAKLRF